MTQRRELDPDDASTGLAGFAMKAWKSVPTGASLDDAPLVWTTLAGPQGQRLTMVRVKVAAARAVIVPSASVAQEFPAVGDSLRLSPSRLLAEFDLGQPAALQIGTVSVGRMLRDEPTLAIAAQGVAMIRPKGYRGARLLASAQGNLPPDGGPFTAIGTDDAGHLMLIHSTEVPMSAVRPLMVRIGLRRVVVFGGVSKERMGQLYSRSSGSSNAPLLAQALLQDAQPQPADKLTLGNAKLLIERRP